MPALARAFVLVFTPLRGEISLPQLSKCLQTLSLSFQHFSLRVTCHHSQSLQRPEISPGRKDSREITGIKAECSQALPVLMPKRVNDFW